MYITGPYEGAPFGLSIVDPVKAGPFDLERDTSNPAQDPPCDCVVVRAKIEINPVTAELTVTTDPSGPYAIPHIIDGVPVQIKAVNVTVNREHFMFNPTSCSPMSMTGTIGGDEGAAAALSVPFQATNCASLKFEPKTVVTTAAQASKRDGASLKFDIAYPKGAQGHRCVVQIREVHAPQTAPGPADDDPAGLSRGDVRSEPQQLPAALEDRRSRRPHPGAPSAVERPDLLRQLRLGEVPRRRDPALRR